MGGKPRGWQHLRMLFLFVLAPLQLISGSVDDPSGSKEGKSAVNPSSGSSTGLDAFYVFLGILGVVLLAVFFYRLWQKKKRLEQHARLLRLFEEDDELELELGLRE